MFESSPRPIFSNQFTEKVRRMEGSKKPKHFLGPLAQRKTRVTTNQEIAGSNPARLENTFLEYRT